MQWKKKLSRDLLEEYDFSMSPSSMLTDSTVDGGSLTKPPCVCDTSDPGCSHSSNNVCMSCKTSEPCSTDTSPDVKVGLYIDKFMAADLKSSSLKVKIWLRLVWYDQRLAFDQQCYGGVDVFEAPAESGSLENTKIWTPDLELYNAEENFWGGNALGPRLASVYACGGPGSLCGYVFWSRPGVASALCRYYGLTRFPYDELSCVLEMGGWAVDGRYQDLNLRSSDQGVTWMSESGLAAMFILTFVSNFWLFLWKAVRGPFSAVSKPNFASK